MAITRDNGSNFPVTASNTAASSITSPTFSTNSPTVIVVRAGTANFDGTQYTDNVTASWVGGTPAGATTFSLGVKQVASFKSHGAFIWYATASQALTNASVTVTGLSNTTSQFNYLAVDALVGASSVVGVTGTKVAENSNTSVEAALTGVTTGSWLFLAAGGEWANSDPATWTGNRAGTVTTKAGQRGGADSYAALAENTSGSGGNIAIGWSDAADYVQAAALEIKAAPPPGLTVDREFWINGQGTNSISGPVTTSFGNELLVVVAPHAIGNDFAQVTSISATGPSTLAFTPVVSSTDYATTLKGYASIWAAWASQSGAYNVTVTYVSGYGVQNYTVSALTGVKDGSSNVLSSFGQTMFLNNQNFTGPTTSTLTGVTSGSYVFAAALDWNQYADRTSLIGAQNIVCSSSCNDGAGDTYMMWRSPTAVSGGNVTMGSPNSLNQLTWFAMAEVLSADTGTVAPDTVVSISSALASTDTSRISYTSTGPAFYSTAFFSGAFYTGDAVAGDTVVSIPSAVVRSGYAAISPVFGASVGLPAAAVRLGTSAMGANGQAQVALPTAAVRPGTSAITANGGAVVNLNPASGRADTSSVSAVVGGAPVSVALAAAVSRAGTSAITANGGAIVGLTAAQVRVGTSALAANGGASVSLGASQIAGVAGTMAANGAASVAIQSSQARVATSTIPVQIAGGPVVVALTPSVSRADTSSINPVFAASVALQAALGRAGYSAIGVQVQNFPVSVALSVAGATASTTNLGVYGNSAVALTPAQVRSLASGLAVQVNAINIVVPLVSAIGSAIASGLSIAYETAPPRMLTGAHATSGRLDGSGLNGHLDGKAIPSKVGGRAASDLITSHAEAGRIDGRGKA